MQGETVKFVSDKIYREIQHNFMFKNVFPKIVPFMK